MAALSPNAVSAATTAPLVPEGTQYALAGSPLGDQLAPSLAFRVNGGCVVWQDNLTDGDGFGISARRLSGQLSGLSSLRVNQDGAGDQENPQVAILSDGGNLIVWQSGVRGAQRIQARVLKSDGQFAGPEFTVSSGTSDHRNPNLSVAGDGSVLVVWTADGSDGDMSGVLGRRLSSSGEILGQPFTINQFSRFNQRDPVVATTGNGGLVVAWISEQQRGENSVDVVARRLGSDGSFSGDEFYLNTARRLCTTPAIVGLAGGGFAAAWSEHQTVDSAYLWDVFGRIWGDSDPTGSDFRINTRRNGFQLMPHLAVSGDSILAVYRSDQGDGYGEGVVGQWIKTDGSLAGDEFVVNTKTAGDQLNPTVAADSTGRLIVAWSTFSGIARGMDLAAQRFALPSAPLAAPGAPYLFAASSSKLLITWSTVSGLGVAGYDVYVDGSPVGIRTLENSYSLGGLAPGSTHSVRIGYVLSDGRKSPLSSTASATTWGEDDNADGLPDDWQRLHFGENADGWPAPGVDSDGDGATNRAEFLAGTDPSDATSVLQVTLMGTPQGALMIWNTRPGAIYQPQWSADLKEWNNLGSPRLAAGTTDSMAAGESPASSYFRVNLLR
ncbi:MAG: fibronectin type III domain-containing protein [Verrucomicrobiales bacterium]|nr:fibronectin type III domain-containing protein [Verrucomicrobiales bacterium]